MTTLPLSVYTPPVAPHDITVLMLLVNYSSVLIMVLISFHNA